MDSFAAFPLDALVVLGCRVKAPQGPPGALWRRAQRAASAYLRGEAPLVLTCGGRRWQGQAEAWALREALRSLGVPGEAILLELTSLDTAENARHAASLLHPRGVQRVGLVTCDWHMPRALVLFRKVGLKPTPLAAPSPRCPPWPRLRRGLREHLARWLDALR
jgi:uncharacterized SAM-binding protein YcdF (DUF218 family)